MKKTVGIVLAMICLSIGMVHSQTQEGVQYIDTIMEYRPAPGQFINTSPGLPENAQSLKGGINGLVTLGYFGGYLIAGFDEPISNHPDNPYGVDFTVFGNGYTGSSEPGIVMVMKDENANGKPDDTWYELRGSDHFLSSSIKGYEITFTNPNGYLEVPWSDNMGGTGVVNINSFHQQSYYPSQENFPDIDPTSYMLSGTKLKDKTFQAGMWINSVFDYGYADNRPMKSGQAHDVPDNPYTLDTQEGCGGDAFDISWAVDADGKAVELDEISFVKIYTGVAANAGSIGEVSTEIRGIAAVAPDASITGPTDVIVTNHPPFLPQFSSVREYEWPQGESFEFEAYVVSKGQLNANQTIGWESNNPEIASISASGVLTGHEAGEVEITATWQADNTISRQFTINITPTTSSGSLSDIEAIKVFPNPFSDYISVSGSNRATVSLFNTAGIKVMEKMILSEQERINLADMPRGLYLVRIETDNRVTTTKLLKQ